MQLSLPSIRDPAPGHAFLLHSSPAHSQWLLLRIASAQDCRTVAASGGFLGGFFEVVSKRLNFVNTWIRNLPLGQFSQPRIVETSVTADTSPASFALLEPFLDKRIDRHRLILAKACYENKPHFANQYFFNLGM